MLRLFLFLLFPALELYLLVKVGGIIGALTMVLWVFASMLFGIWVVRAHSQYSMAQIRASMTEGRMPQYSIMDGLLLFLAGVLLILPGLISDAIGLLLLLPFVRQAVAESLGRYFQNRQSTGSTTIFFTNIGGPGQGPAFDPRVCPPREPDEGPRQATVIESTAIEIDPDQTPDDRQEGSGPSGKKE